MQNIRKKLEQSVDLSIEVDNLALSHLPGDTLHGVVKRIQLDSSQTSKTIFLSLIGRIDTKVIHPTSGDNPDNHYTAEAGFLTERLCLYQGPVNAGLNSWPFSVTIPSFLTRNGVNVATPPSHIAQHNENVPYGYRNYLICQYYLEAEVHGSADPRHPKTSIFPLFVRTRTGDGAHQGLVATACPGEVKTLRLDSQLAGQSLSFRQHMQGIFQRSTLPHFAFTVTVSHATVIQIDHPLAMPLRLTASPDAVNTKTPSSMEKPPPLKLLSVKLHFQHQTQVQNLQGSSPAKESLNHWTDWSLIHWECRSGDAPPVIPYGEDLNALELGRDFGMRTTWLGVHSTGRHKSTSKGWEVSPHLWPSTESHFIAIKHQLAWSLQVECAGKTRKIRGESPLVVLGPDQVWEQELAKQVGREGLLRAHKKWATEEQVVIPVLGLEPPSEVQGRGVRTEKT